MSDSKSLIKRCFESIREPTPPLRAYPHVISDLAIKMYGLTMRTQAEAYHYFVAHAMAQFTTHDAHTVTLALDWTQYMPARKKSKQRERGARAADAMQRQRVPAWTYDGVSPVLALTDAPLPPWPRVVADRSARARAERDVVDLLTRHFVPPPGRRLRLIARGLVITIEATATDGRVLAPVVEPLPVQVGEVDMLVVYLARDRCRDDATPSRDAFRDDASEWVHLRDAAERVSVTECRRVYEAGAMLLVTRDSDALVIGTAAVEHLAPPAAPEHALMLALGADEYYDLARVRTLPSFRSLWDFVALCACGGNDYVRQLYGFSHRSLFAHYETYTGPPLTHTDVATGEPRLDVAAYLTFVRHAYTQRLPKPKKRKKAEDAVVPLTWPDVCARMTTAMRERLPTAPDLHRHVDAVAFSVHYMFHAADGRARLDTEPFVAFTDAASL